MRRQAFILATVALFLGAVPLVSAYEAHLINVTAHVEERFNIVKTMRLATPDEIRDFGTPCPDPNPQTGTDPANVPIETCVVWLVTITASNPHSYSITEVVVTDNFSAEMAGEPLGSIPVDLFIKTHSRGKSGKESFETQYRITWYVTWQSGEPADPETIDNSGWLEPGGSATLEILVWTKLNPSGRQEYTSPGTYTLNSGPTMKWRDPDGYQGSNEGPPLNITAYE